MAPQVKTSRGRARTRISAEHQVTLPAEVMKTAGLRPGDVLEVEATGQGTVRLRRLANPFRAAAGTLTGVFGRGDLNELRDEWD